MVNFTITIPRIIVKAARNSKAPGERDNRSGSQKHQTPGRARLLRVSQPTTGSSDTPGVYPMVSLAGRRPTPPPGGHAGAANRGASAGAVPGARDGQSWLSTRPAHRRSRHKNNHQRENQRSLNGPQPGAAGQAIPEAANSCPGLAAGAQNHT